MSQLQSRRRIRKHWTQTPRGRRIQRNKMLKMWRVRKDAKTAEVVDARLVDHVETLPTAYADTLPLDDHGKDALKAILDNVWHGMTLEEKIAMLDPRDPSNPEGL